MKNTENFLFWLKLKMKKNVIEWDRQYILPKRETQKKNRKRKIQNLYYTYKRDEQRRDFLILLHTSKLFCKEYRERMSMLR